MFRAYNPIQMEAVTEMVEKCYRVKELVEITGFSDWTIRRMFTKEPGVVTIAEKSRGVRRYRTTTIPESVVQRVLGLASKAA